MKHLLLLCFSFFTFSLKSVAQPGYLDITFGLNGSTFTTVGGQWDVIDRMAILPDGSILVAGSNHSSFFGDQVGASFMYKLLSDGKVDTSFGIRIYELIPGKEYVRTIATLPDGKIMMLSDGYSLPNTPHSILLSRFLPDGSQDISFGQGGVIFTDFGFNRMYAGEILIMPDSKILLCGVAYATLQSNPKYVLIKLNSDGSPDASFGTGGIVSSEEFLVSDFHKMAVLPDGKILCAGQMLYNGGGGYSVLLAKFMADGTPDIDFGTAGVATHLVAPGFNYVRDFWLTEEGKFYAHGGNSIGLFTADGSLDLSFGQNGFVAAYGNNMVLTSNGKLLEWTNLPNPSLFDTLIWIRQLLPDGQPDSSFGVNGEIVTGAVGDGRAGLLDQQGRLVIGGSHFVRATIDSLFTDGAVFRFATELSLGIFDDDTHTENTVLVYPNPIGTQARFSFEIKKATALSLHLMDMNGRLVHDFFTSRNFNTGEQTEDLLFPPGLPPGAYVLVLKGQERRIATQIILR